MPDDIPRIAYVEDEGDEKQTKLLQDLIAARPVLRRKPCLIVVGGNRSVGKIFRLRPGHMTIGRSIACDIVLEEEGVSRHHATVIVDQEGAVAVDDAGSANGLIYAGTKVTRQALREGDRIEIGDAGVALLHMDDIDETVRQNLLESATEDDETRLYTRRHFKELVSRELAFAQRYHSPLSLLICAVDAFKAYVDRNGRAAGIAELRRASRVAHDLFAREDVIFARFAEDQFAIALPETDAADASTSATMLCKALASSTLSPSHQSRRVTMTIGIATTGTAERPLEELLESAERSLYRAKIAGGNRVGPIES
jgi:diguanylate cyclase (GGDEF)-like protein